VHDYAKFGDVKIYLQSIKERQRTHVAELAGCCCQRRDARSAAARALLKGFLIDLISTE
jgi:hypothetical protein